MKKYLIAATLAGVAVIPLAAQAKTVTVPPAACGGAYTSSPCSLHVPTTDTIYSTTTPKGPLAPGLQAWSFHAKKGQHYSLKIAYTGPPVQTGKVTLTVALFHVPPKKASTRGLFLCTGPDCPTGQTVEAVVTPAGGVIPVPVGHALTGKFPATGSYAIAVTSQPTLGPVPYRLDLRIH